MNKKDDNRYGLVASVSVRNNIKTLGPLLKFIRAFCSGVGLSDQKQEAAVSVLEQTLSSRINEAYSSVGMITLSISLMPAYVSFGVSDSGAPYILSGEKNGDAERQAFSLADRHYMSIEHGKGQRVTFEFAYDDKDFDIQTLRRTEYPREELSDKTVEIRRVSTADEDIIKVIECIYSAYGYSYCHEKLYNLDVFKRLLASGNLHSYVASNKSSQMLAHAALSNGEFMRGMPDLGTLVTKPFCRGLHIAERLVKHMLSDAEAMGYRGVRGEPVAFHPYTQKLFTANGMVPAGFLFHAVNPESCGIYRSGSERKDLTLGQICFKHDEVHSIALPGEHADFLKKLFERLGLKIEDPSPTEKDCPGFIHRSVDQTMRTGTLVVRGDDWMSEGCVPKIISEMSEAEVLCLYLDLGHPGSLNAYDTFIQNGFFVTGVVANSEDGDYLVLQHLMGRQLKISNLVLEPEYKRLFDYFRSFMDEKMFCES